MAVQLIHQYLAHPDPTAANDTAAERRNILALSETDDTP